MESKQPIILYREGFEPQVKKINNCCRMELLRILKEAMSEEYGEVKRDQVFTHIMALQSNRLKLSWKLVHSHLCKELITSKRFVFTRTPLRFSLQKYPDVTGLKISRESSSDVVKWKDDRGFWSKLLKVGGKITLKSIRKVHLQKVHNWTRLDRLRLIYLCVIMGMVMGKDEKVNIPHMYIKLVMDLDKGELFSVISQNRLGDVLLQTAYAEPDGSVDDTDVAAEVDTPATNVAGRGKRKIHDEATVSGIYSKKITLDPETKNFIQGLIHTSVISLGDRLSTQLEKMEAGFVERMGKMES
uniref:DUF1985 domain-containing protein n=1 Tax=Brassica oleracea TaxID=3712 RepID=A0A3P6BES9_BRAOL|nr:unnamed protein product [Brassica oleracea]